MKYVSVILPIILMFMMSNHMAFKDRVDHSLNVIADFYTSVQNNYANSYALSESRISRKLDIDHIKSNNLSEYEEYDPFENEGNSESDVIFIEEDYGINPSIALDSYATVIALSKGLDVTARGKQLALTDYVLAFNVITKNGVYKMNNTALFKEAGNTPELITNNYMGIKYPYINDVILQGNKIKALFNLGMREYKVIETTSNNIVSANSRKLLKKDRDIAKKVITQVITESVISELTEHQLRNIDILNDIYIPIYNSSLFGNREVSNTTVLSYTKNLYPTFKDSKNSFNISGDRFTDEVGFIVVKVTDANNNVYSNYYIPYNVYKYYTNKETGKVDVKKAKIGNIDYDVEVLYYDGFYRHIIDEEYLVNKGYRRLL